MCGFWLGFELRFGIVLCLFRFCLVFGLFRFCLVLGLFRFCLVLDLLGLGLNFKLGFFLFEGSCLFDLSCLDFFVFFIFTFI